MYTLMLYTLMSWNMPALDTILPLSPKYRFWLADSI